MDDGGVLGCVALEDTKTCEDDVAVDPHDAVLKVFVAQTQFNYSTPWATHEQTTVYGSAFVCNWEVRRFIITNAHVVRYASLIELRKRCCNRKHVAQVLCSGVECDLALLDITDCTDFFQGVPEIALCSDLPELGDEVTCVGFPTGGDNLCITQGVVSRVDMQSYPTSYRQLLVIQIDAAINPGSSGGPVLNSQGQCIGIAFQALNDTDNVGYIIPIRDVVVHFLKDFIAHGRYTGFGDLGFSLLPLENKHMRRSLGLPAEGDGAMVHRIHMATPASKVVRRGDVLFSIDGHSVGQDGKVLFGSKARIDASFVATSKFVGETCEVTLGRGGERFSACVELSYMDWLVTMDPAAPPEYFIIGGLVFTVLTEPFLRDRFGSDFERNAPSLLAVQWNTWTRREVEGHQIVVLAQVLADDLTQGFTSVCNALLETVNSERVRNLRHAVSLLDGCSDEWLRFDLADEETIVLPRVEARAATARILERNMIAHDRSARLRAGAVAQSQTSDSPFDEPVLS